MFKLVKRVACCRQPTVHSPPQPTPTPPPPPRSPSLSPIPFSRGWSFPLQSSLSPKPSTSLLSWPEHATPLPFLHRSPLSPSYAPSAPCLPHLEMEGFWLDCPSCKQHWKDPIYQCIKGHSVCSDCCDTNKNTCPFCGNPIGKLNHYRNLHLEWMLDCCRVCCPNIECTEKPFKSEFDSHLASCQLN